MAIDPVRGPPRLRPLAVLFCAVIVGLLGGIVTGCGSTVTLGVEPAVERLGALQVGRSGKSDVREVLGEPQGEGMARMPDYPGLRTVWAYDYVELEGKRAGMFMLFVFFDGDVYDGYTWFNAAAAVKPAS